MPRYRVRFQGPDRKTHKFESRSESREDLMRQLKDQGRLPIEIKELSSKRKKIRLTTKDAKDLSALLALLLGSGHSLSDSLQLLTGGMNNSRIASACELWGRDLEHGASFKDALASPEVKVPSGFKSLVGIGDRVGALESVLVRLEDYFRRLSDLKERLTTALVYPAMVLLMAIGTGIFIGTFIIPKMSEILSVLDPKTAEVAYKSGAISNGMTIIMFSMLALIVFFLTPMSSRIKEIRSAVVLRIPFVGGFLRDWDLLNWTFSMEVMLSGKVPMRTALDEAAATVRNTILAKHLKSLASGLDKGESLAYLLELTPRIPKMVPSWIAIGEKTGKDDEVFKPLRMFFEDRVKRLIDLATQLVEPIIILLLGGGIVYFLVRYLLPLFRMMGEIR